MTANNPAAATHPRYLLVDFENVHEIDLDKVPSQIKIILFVGAHQKTVSVDFVEKTQHLGSRLRWEHLSGGGKNALDFFIAYHIGRMIEKYPQAECIILSKDKGFDPLVASLKKEGKKCRRVEGVGGLK